MKVSTYVRSRAALAAAFGLLMTACAGPDGDRADPLPARASTAAETVVLTGETFRSAGITGAVSRVGQCAGIGDSVAVWPLGTEVVGEDPLMLRVPGLGVLEEGDTVTGGGGVADAAVDDLVLEVPSTCGTTEVVMFRVE